MTLRHRGRSEMVRRVQAYGYTPGRCAYCGRHLRSSFVCAAHADLLRHDPLMLAAQLPATVKR